jgi:hypothetical protein
MLQWFWFSTSAQQKYESSVDIVVPAANTTMSEANVVNGTAAFVPTRGQTGHRGKMRRMVRFFGRVEMALQSKD